MQGSRRMSVRTKQEYFLILRERYQKAASKKERSLIVTEACVTSGLHRKSAIRALNQIPKNKIKIVTLGRPKKYSAGCTELLKKLYRASDAQCSDKLKVMMPVLFSQLRSPVDVIHREEVLQMSSASIDRYLKLYRSQDRRRRNSGTRPGSKLFKKMIPLKSLGNIAPRPGFLQADTVSHGGENASGDFIWSLTVTDEKVGFTMNQAVYGKAAKNILPAIQFIHQRLPFELIAFNVDNGTEFMNQYVYEYFHFVGEKNTVPFPMTRSRAYRKNDNCHVEQKNWTSVRQLFGYDRLDDKELVPLMNEIYRVQNLISNYFIPQMKLKSKVRIGAKIKKTYDKPKTPYQRILEEVSVSEEQKQKLRETYASLNYFDLQNEREELLARFESLKKELIFKKSTG